MGGPLIAPESGIVTRRIAFTESNIVVTTAGTTAGTAAMATTITATAKPGI